MKILLVDGNEYYALELAKVLKSHKYHIEVVKDTQNGIALAKAFDYDLLMLNVMFPEVDNVSLCRQLRLEGYQTPIMMLVGNENTSLGIEGIKAGADDYVVQSVEISELVARIQALLRRGRAVLPTLIGWKNLQIDINNREVIYEGKRLHLTPKEYGLLELFVRNPRKIFNRSALLSSIWLSSEYPGEEAVTTHIKGLRQKLKAAGINADFIETVYGVGYRLKEANQETRKLGAKQQGKHGCKTMPGSQCLEKRKAEAEVTSVVKRVWTEFKENSLGQHLELFERVLTDLATGTPDRSLLKQAQAEAHRLAGSLGCYGLLEGSTLARQIELLLQNLTISRENGFFELKNLNKSLKKSILLLKKTLQEQEEFEESLLGKRFELFEQVLGHLSTENWKTLDNQLLKQAQAEAHRLADSLKCYGLLEGSTLVWRIELLLQTLIILQPIINLRLENLEKFIKLLKNTLQEPFTPATPPTSKTPPARLLIIDDDTVLTELIKVEAEAWGLQ